MSSGGLTGPVVLKPADIVFTRSTHKLGGIIRRLTRSRGESKTETNHVGIVVLEGTEQTATIVEALWSVKRHTLGASYGGSRDEVAVYRPINLTARDRRTIVATAEKYVGKPYGPLKLVLHALDAPFGTNLFRRLAVLDGFPICSYVVAAAYAKAGYHFGVSTKAAQPDDIWDFCDRRDDRYRLMRKWGTIAE